MVVALLTELQLLRKLKKDTAVTVRERIIRLKESDADRRAYYDDLGTFTQSLFASCSSL